MLTKITDRRARRRWARAESAAETLDPIALKDLHSEANRLSRRLNRVLQVAEARLKAPPRAPANLSRATHTDWEWRPALWTMPIKPSGIVEVATGSRVGPDATIFHDCNRREITLHQSRTEDAVGSNFAATIEVLSFEGSYLSLALDLPSDALNGLSRHHIIRLNVALRCERPLHVYARLNLRHGPNVDRVTAKFADDSSLQTLEFDLASTCFDETRLNRAWLDVIFETPSMNRMTLESVSLNRRHRADI